MSNSFPIDIVFPDFSRDTILVSAFMLHNTGANLSLENFVTTKNDCGLGFTLS